MRFYAVSVPFSKESCLIHKIWMLGERKRVDNTNCVRPGNCQFSMENWEHLLKSFLWGRFFTVNYRTLPSKHLQTFCILSEELNRTRNIQWYIKFRQPRNGAFLLQQTAVMFQAFFDLAIRLPSSIVIIIIIRFTVSHSQLPPVLRLSQDSKELQGGKVPFVLHFVLTSPNQMIPVTNWLWHDVFAHQGPIFRRENIFHWQFETFVTYVTFVGSGFWWALAFVLEIHSASMSVNTARIVKHFWAPFSDRKQIADSCQLPDRTTRLGFWDSCITSEKTEIRGQKTIIRSNLTDI